MTKRCCGCYDSFSGPWCDNCDQWPCICYDWPTLEPDPMRAAIETASAQAGQAARTED